MLGGSAACAWRRPSQVSGVASLRRPREGPSPRDEGTSARTASAERRGYPRRRLLRRQPRRALLQGFSGRFTAPSALLLAGGARNEMQGHGCVPPHRSLRAQTARLIVDASTSPPRQRTGVAKIGPASAVRLPRESALPCAAEASREVRRDCATTRLVVTEDELVKFVRVHLVASSPRRLVTSSPRHLVTSSPRHLVTSSPRRMRLSSETASSRASTKDSRSRVPASPARVCFKGTTRAPRNCFSPWHTHKACVIFSDVPGTLRRVSWGQRLLDPAAIPLLRESLAATRRLRCHCRVSLLPLSPRSGRFGGGHRPQREARGRMGWGQPGFGPRDFRSKPRAEWCTRDRARWCTRDRARWCTRDRARWCTKDRGWCAKASSEVVHKAWSEVVHKAWSEVVQGSSGVVHKASSEVVLQRNERGRASKERARSCFKGTSEVVLQRNERVVNA
jgi:hypothetical protein